ncbi:potassium channel family protein [Pontibacter russatus]|uniref:potassium channel family protein n=1 Tax=Pontibacter russatus TaxID=2694929 RepID=UPI00137A33F3|nr:potassium channel family protein [Pontibacter russatus]
MKVFYLCLGVFLYAVTALDIIKTTFSSNGGGMVTNAVSRTVWSAFLSAAGKSGRSRLLSYAGPAVLVSVLLTWILGLWSGLFLLLMSEANSVVNSKDMASASALEKLYYAGFSLSTLGVGDFIASDSLWRIVTSVAAFSGLVFITASITYFVPVLSAVNLQSRLSLYISSMGKTPQEILSKSWNGKDFSAFFDNVSDICQMLMQHTLNHHSYPVVHYFHNNQPKLSIAPAIVLLHEALLLLKHAVPKEARGNKMKTAMLQTALDSYLEMVRGNFLKNPSPKEKAPVPDVGLLEEQHIPLLDKEEIRQAFCHTLHDRRMLLTAALEMDGWSWREVYGS